jgi:hypothetical protein
MAVTGVTQPALDAIQSFARSQSSSCVRPGDVTHNVRTAPTMTTFAARAATRIAAAHARDSFGSRKTTGRDMQAQSAMTVVGRPPGLLMMQLLVQLALA